MGLGETQKSPSKQIHLQQVARKRKQTNKNKGIKYNTIAEPEAHQAKDSGRGKCALAGRHEGA